MTTTRTLLTALAACVALVGCRFEDIPPSEGATADTGGAPGQPDTATPGDTTLPDPPSDVVAVTPPDAWVDNPLQVPRNIHLSFQSDPSRSMVVSWATSDVELADYKPRLWVVPTAILADYDDNMPYAEGYVVEGYGIKYKETLLGIDKSDEEFVVFHAEVTGLEPQTEYTYRVGTWTDFDPETGTFTGPQLSDRRTFATGIPKGERTPFKMVLAGDSRNGYDGIEKNMPRFVEMDADLWFFNGDMNQDGFQEQWDTWFTVMEPLVSNTPLMPVQGNHEIFAGLYYNQFELPKHDTLPDDYVEHAWRMHYGNVVFIGLDSNTQAAVEDQKQWLEATLKEVSEDPDVDWIITMSHHPAYSACTKHGSTQRMLDHWVPLLEKYGVDLAFAGHDHNYERSKPVRGSQVVGPDEGVVYVVAGAFYSPAYTNGQDWWTEISHHGDKGNYVVAEVSGKSITLTAYSGDGTEVLDQWTMQK